MKSDQLVEDRPLRIGLALGGGAARGLAHVGVLKVLIEAGVPIDMIAGTSMGALIGAAYCAGIEMDEMCEIATHTGWRHISRPTIPHQGILSLEKMEQWMIDRIGDVDARDLALPFAAVATDVVTGERVILREGPVSRIVRASCSVPGLVAPIQFDGMLLCDGGVSDNLPDEPARLLGADYVIGVDVFAPAYRNYLGPAGVALAALESLVRRAGGGDVSVDCLIVPELVGHSYIRLSKHQEFISAGESATRAKLPVILSDINRLQHPLPVRSDREERPVRSLV